MVKGGSEPEPELVIDNAWVCVRCLTRQRLEAQDVIRDNIDVRPYLLYVHTNRRDTRGLSYPVFTARYPRHYNSIHYIIQLARQVT